MIEQVVIGLVITLFGAVIIYAFKTRQLYVVIPRLFPKSKLSDNSNIVELRVFNKSRMMEEDVLINLNSSYNYEIIASTLEEIQLEKNKLSISRLAQGDEFSILLLAEDGNFSDKDITSISSKTTKGKLIKDLQSIPPNFGSALLSILFLVFLVSIPFLSINLYNSINDNSNSVILKEQNSKYNFLKEEGWSEYDRFVESELSKLYIDKEFPIYQSSMKRKGNIVLINFKLINKYARDMNFIISYENPYKKFDPKPLENRVSYIVNTGALETKDLKIRVYFPKKYMDKIKVRFSINTKGKIFTFYKKINMNI